MNQAIINEKQILERAISELKKMTGAGVKRLPVSAGSVAAPDAMVEIKLRQIRHEFMIEIKGEVREHMIEHITGRFGKQKDKWLLVARYIPGPIKEFLKKHGYNYLEMTGNCFISTDQLFISINDKEVKHVLKTPEGKLWKAAGLKFLFVVLQDPTMLSKPQRMIAQAAGIASGNISNFLEELRNSGYLIGDTGVETLLHREKLIERWVEAFYITLRPKLQKGIFRFLRVNQQKEWREIELSEIYWAGEPGADLYTNFLTPESFTLYTSRPTTDLIVKLKIVQDPGGYITVLEKFWNDWSTVGTVPYAAPLLLVYAELKNSLDSRNWEAAERIKKLILNAK